MAFYSFYEGVLRFKTHKETYEAAQILLPWINEDKIREAVRDRSLVFPEIFEGSGKEYARNIHRGLNQLSDTMDFNGTLLGTSNDGVLEGYLFSKNKYEVFCLEEWVKKESKELYNELRAVSEKLDKLEENSSAEGDDIDNAVAEKAEVEDRVFDLFELRVGEKLLPAPSKAETQHDKKLFGSILRPGQVVSVLDLVSGEERQRVVKGFDGVEYEMEDGQKLGHNGYIYNESTEELLICMNAVPFLCVTKI